MKQTVTGVFVIQHEGAQRTDDSPDRRYGGSYYPLELKCTFEVMQKVLMDLDRQGLLSRLPFLKNKSTR
uniref:Uncharacterized protein n=1 Tax=Cynoglossus semilaevis TaxID=244447 RepID=A0A3P8VKQ0_CYNSE